MMLALALLALPRVQSDTPDLIVLANGEEIECRVLFEDEATIHYTKKRKVEQLAALESSRSSRSLALRRIFRVRGELNRSKVSRVTLRTGTLSLSQRAGPRLSSRVRSRMHMDARSTVRCIVMGRGRGPAAA